MSYINVKRVGQLIREHDRQPTILALAAINREVAAAVRRACEVANGGRKRLSDVAVAMGFRNTKQG